MHFYVHPQDSESVGIAIAPPHIDNDTIPVDGIIPRWKTLQLTLESGTFTDFLGSEVIWHIFSVKARGIIDRLAGGTRGLQWLELAVFDQAGNMRPYFILHLAYAPDVLNLQRTRFVAGKVIVKACLDPSKARDQMIFRFPHDPVSLIVREEIKEAFEADGCTGMEFAAFHKGKLRTVMSLVPNKRSEKIEFFESHAAGWGES